MALALGAATTASASSIVHVCGANLCRIDPAQPKRVTHLTRDGRTGSRLPEPVAVGEGHEAQLRQGQPPLRRRRRCPACPQDRRARGRGGHGDAARRHAGRLHPRRLSPGFTYPYYSPPVYGIVPFLFVRGVGAGKS
jgi:hypothetical protein